MNIIVNGRVHPAFRNILKTFGATRVEKEAFGFQRPFFSPGGYGDCWWEIDTSLAAEGYAWMDFGFSKGIMENFFEVQKPDGRIPLYGPDRLPVSPHHPRQIEGASALPVLLPVLSALTGRSGDRKFREKAYNLMNNYLQWWKKERLNEKTGLITSLFEETFPPYLGTAGEYCGVDTNVLVALGARKASALASDLGKTDEAKEWKDFSEEVFRAAEEYFWDEETGLFRPLALQTGRRGSMTAQGFFMMFDPYLPREREKRLLEALKGKAFNWGKIPVTSMAKDDPAYTTTCTEAYQFNESWSGMVWTLINRYLAMALIEKGTMQDAAYVASQTVDLVAGDCREFYSPDDGKGYGAQTYAWSAANALCLFLEVLCGIDYSAKEGVLKITPQIRDRIEIDDLALGEDGFADVILTEGKVQNVILKTEKTIKIETEG